MVRLTVTVLHTVLAVATTSAALLLLGQARANDAWERGFYAHSSEGTHEVLFAALVALAFGLAHGTSAVAWFAGSRRGGWVVIAACLLLSAGAPLAVGMVLGASGLVVSLDLMVERQRDRGPPPA